MLDLFVLRLSGGSDRFPKKRRMIPPRDQLVIKKVYIFGTMSQGAIPCPPFAKVFAELDYGGGHRILKTQKVSLATERQVLLDP